MNKVLIILLAAAAVAGCAKVNPDNNQETGTQTPIAVMGRSLSVETRAPFEGEISSTNKLTALIPASLTDGNYTTQYALGTMIFGDETNAVGYDATGFTGNKNYPANENTPVYLAGLYPATGWNSYGTTASITFTGKEDIMSAQQTSTTKADATASPAVYKNLAFRHLLTKLTINVVAEDAGAANAWGTIKEITLVKSQNNSAFSNAAAVNLKTGVAAFSGTASKWAVYNGDAAITNSTITIPTGTAAKAGYTIVAPITATAVADADFTVAIKTMLGGTEYSKNDIAVTLKNTSGTDFSGSTAGKSFNVTLTFKAKGIQASASVSEWENGGNADSDVD